jgi:hypothetical protein
MSLSLFAPGPGYPICLRLAQIQIIIAAKIRYSSPQQDIMTNVYNLKHSYTLRM